MIAYDERQMGEENREERPLAPESLKTRRAREKLLKQWAKENKQITPKAIAESVDKIRKWIADHAQYRDRIEKENIELFNRNQNAAVVSRKVQQFAEKLKQDMHQFGKALEPANKG